MMEAGFFNPFPKYLQIRQILRRRLAHDFRPGDRLPTELELVEQFGVSRETIREALRGLEEDGLIRRRRGWGTVVMKTPGPAPDERLTGLVDDLTELKLNTRAEVLNKGVEYPPPEVTAALGVPASEPMFRIRRRRFFDSAPLSHHDCYLPVEIGVAVARLDLSKTTVLHEIASTLGHALHEDFQHIDATVADTDMAELLGLSVGAPLLVVTRAFGVRSYGPTMFFRSHFRSDRYYYTVQPKAAPASATGRARKRHRDEDRARASTVRAVPKRGTR